MNQYKFEKGFNIRRFTVWVAIILLIVYGFFNARNLIIGPEIDIYSPSNNIETADNLIVIKGKAENVSFISLNERLISVDSNGLFQEKFLLSPGSNIIEIKASDRFKKTIQKSLQIYYKQETSTTTEINL